MREQLSGSPCVPGATADPVKRGLSLALPPSTPLSLCQCPQSLRNDWNEGKTEMIEVPLQRAWSLPRRRTLSALLHLFYSSPGTVTGSSSN